MDKVLKIVYRSILVTGRQPIWWLFALLQAMAFSAVGQLARPRMLYSPVTVWLILAAVLLAPLTIWLWQSIEYESASEPKIRPKRNFLRQNISGSILILVTVLIIILARLIFPFWPLHTLVFAVTAASSGLALLYLALCEQDLPSSLRLAMDTWNKKISFSAAAALVLLVAHGISYGLMHGILENTLLFNKFSVAGHSATIWVLLLGLMLVIGYISAILNCFVVFLFLEIIARKKAPEAEKAKAAQPVSVGAV